jgi:hypothetical protein
MAWVSRIGSGLPHGSIHLVDASHEFKDSSRVPGPQRSSDKSGFSDARSRNVVGGFAGELPAERELRCSDNRTVTPCRRSKHLDAGRERTYILRDSELMTLTDIGTLRILKLNDLVTHRYGGDPVSSTRDLDNLKRQGLILSHTTYPQKTVYLTLTKSAYEFLEARRGMYSKSAQVFYHGLVKPREVRHDAALYALYQRESARINKAGGRVQRVILDFELKQKVNRKLASLQSLPCPEQMERKREIAEENSLPIVNGKIALPDLRLEYEGPDQESGRIDLELVTGDYHAKALAAKAQAGFAMYALAEDAARLRPALSDPEITLNILTL